MFDLRMLMAGFVDLGGVSSPELHSFGIGSGVYSKICDAIPTPGEHGYPLTIRNLRNNLGDLLEDEFKSMRSKRIRAP